MSEDSSNNKAQSGYGFYNLVMVILFAICIINYPESDAKDDNLQEYWIYGQVKLIISIYIVCSFIVFGCCGVCAGGYENQNCLILSNALLFLSMVGVIITDLTFMFILIHNHKEVTKFKYISDNGTMLQVLCMINMFIDLLLTAILGCTCVIGVPLGIISCCNKKQSINTDTSVSNSSYVNKLNPTLLVSRKI